VRARMGLDWSQTGRTMVLDESKIDRAVLATEAGFEEARRLLEQMFSSEK
jgi:hypothetical protein